MGSFLTVQSILAQMVAGATKAASGDTPTESDDTEMEPDEPETESDDRDGSLADSRNRVPTLGGPDGMMLPSKGWRRT